MSLHAIQADLDALSPDAIEKPSIPVDTAYREARQILDLCRQPAEAERFTKVGLKTAFFDRFAQRVEGLREAQQTWTKRYDRDAHTTAINEAVEQATEQRAYALDACDYHLRRDPQAQVVLATIRQGEGHDDLVFDTGALAGLMRDKKEAFAKDETIDVEATATQLEGAGATLSDLVTDTDADITRARALDTRDRAYTLMDEDLGEIRHAARWVYRRDATLRRQFVSDYTRRLQRRSLTRRQQQARQQEEQEQQGGGSDTPTL